MKSTYQAMKDAGDGGGVVAGYCRCEREERREMK